MFVMSVYSNFTITLGSVIMHMQQEQQQGIRPQFVQKPTIRHSGGKIIIECQLSADPKPSITWLLNNRLIVPGERIFTDVRSEGHVHLIVLEISQVNLQDGGEYRAIAKNALGEATATITLNLEGEGR